MTQKWEPNGDSCPKCKNETEFLVTWEVFEYGGQPEEIHKAERCEKCNWVVRFDE